MDDRKTDRRVQKTRALLYEALIDLMIEKGYEAITVQDLIDRANVGRSTFYSHFEDKEQLLVSNMEQLREFLAEQRRQAARQGSASSRFGFSFAMLQHVQGHKRLYKAVAGKQSGAVVLRHMQRMLAGLVQEEIEALEAHRSDAGGFSIPREVLTDFIVGTFMTLLAWWMDRSAPCSAVEVDRMFHRLVLTGVSDL